MAKEMIKLGVSENIEEALTQIESCNLVCTNDGFKVANNDQVAQVKAKQKWKPVENTEGNSRRLDKIEEKLEFIIEFVNKYAQQNDSNLKEVDLHLRMIKHDISDVRSNSKEVISGLGQNEDLKPQNVADSQLEVFSNQEAALDIQKKS